MSNQQNDPQYGADYHGNIQISGNEEMPSGSEQPNSKRDQQFVSAEQAIKSSSGTAGEGDEQSQPDIEPSETGSGQSGTENQSGDPGRTPGKAEGDDDSSAESQNNQQSEDVENYEQTKEKKIAESVSVSS
ncbi:MAG TPA: hypothetical protein VF599_09375 [Pyrinomonadaceae bacterium]|jgi:hypothetical protein